MRNLLSSSLLAVLLAATSLTAQAAPTETSPTTSTANGMATGNMTEMSRPLDKVNINTADALTLQKELSGIGLNKANAIVAYRESNGNFTSIDELIEVSGIGKTLLDRNRDKLAIE